MEKKLDFAEIFNIKELQQLFESISNLNNSALAIIDLEGTMHVWSGFSTICSKFHRINPETQKRCYHSDTILSAVEKNQEYKIYTCQNGMTDVVMPIVVDGIHICNLFTGQFFLNEPDLDFFKKQAKTFGFDEKEYIEAVNKVPMLSEADLKKRIDFLKHLIQIIAELAFKDQQNKDFAAQLETAKEHAEELNKRFEFATSIGKVGTWDWNLQTDGVIWSEETYRILGYEPFSITPSYDLFLDIVHKDDRKELDDSVKAAWYEKKPYSVDCRIILKNNTERICNATGTVEYDESGKPVRMIGTFQDITERKTNELLLQKKNDDLKKQNEFIQTIMEKLPIGIATNEIDSLKVTYISPKFEEIYGWPAKEFPTTVNFFNKVFPDKKYRDTLQAQIMDDISSGDPERMRWDNLNITTQNGEKRIVYAHNIPLPDQNIMVSTVQDVTEIKNAQKELEKEKHKAEESEERFSTIFNMSESLICMADINTATFKFINPAFKNVLGHSEKELLGKSFLEFIHPDDIEKTNNVIENQLQKGKTVLSFENRYKKKNGQYCWLAWNSYPIPEKGITYAIAHDITELKNKSTELQKAKDKVEQNEKDLNEAQELAKIGSWSYDPVTQQPKWSDEMFRIWGLDKDKRAPEYKDHIKYIHRDDWKMFDKAVKMAVEKGVPYNLELRICRPDGKTKTIITICQPLVDEQTGKVLMLKGTNQDISDRKEIENEIRKAKEKAEESQKSLNQNLQHLKNLNNSLVDVVFTVNPIDRKIKFANQAVEKIFGYTKNECIDRNTTFLYPKEQDYLDFGKKLKHTIDSNRDYLKTIQQLKRKNGDLFCAEITVSFIKDKGKILEILSIVRDVSERIKFQNELINAKEKAEQANKLKTEFLHNMSHEIRTPMNGIIGFSKLLSKPELSEKRRDNYSKIVQNSSKQLLKVIDDILEISALETKQETINESEFCLNELLTETFSIFNLEKHKSNVSIYLKKQLNDNQSCIISDKSKLNKILGNLVENALKFTTEGFVEIGYFLKDKNLTIYIKDTGVGIAPENHKIIFERFSQENKELSQKVGGLGLGLSIAKENTELLGGHISLESDKGKGSTFYVTIPYKNASKSKKVDKKNKNEKITDTPISKNILIAEDELVNYMYIEELLDEKYANQFNIIYAKNGKEAVEICNINQNIDLILMDIKMPVMDGHEATELIKEVFPNLPIIAQTAYSTPHEKELALQHGCDDFISKPLDEDELFRLISKYLNNT